MKQTMIAIALMMGAPGLVLAEPPGQNVDVAGELEALKAQLQTQQAEIEQLRADRGDTWLNQRRVEEVKALVQEVLADADTRASLLEGAWWPATMASPSS